MVWMSIGGSPRGKPMPIPWSWFVASLGEARGVRGVRGVNGINGINGINGKRGIVVDALDNDTGVAGFCFNECYFQYIKTI